MAAEITLAGSTCMVSTYASAINAVINASSLSPFMSFASQDIDGCQSWQYREGDLRKNTNPPKSALGGIRMSRWTILDVLVRSQKKGEYDGHGSRSWLTGNLQKGHIRKSKKNNFTYAPFPKDKDRLIRSLNRYPSIITI